MNSLEKERKRKLKELDKMLKKKENENYTMITKRETKNSIAIIFAIIGFVTFLWGFQNLQATRIILDIGTLSGFIIGICFFAAAYYIVK